MVTNSSELDESAGYLLAFFDKITLDSKKNTGMPSVYKFIKKLGESKFEVDVITSQENMISEDEKSVQYIITKRRTCSITNRYAFFLISFFQYLWLNIKYFMLGYRLLKSKGDTNCVLYSTIEFAIAAFFLRLIFKCKTALRFYGVFSAPRLKNPWRLLSLYQECLAFILPADKYIVTNDGTSGDIVARFFNVPDDKLWFTVNGVDVSKTNMASRTGLRNMIREKLGIKDEELFLFCASRLTGWKRVERVILAVRGLKKVKLIIAGDGDQREFYESIADKQNTFFVGLVSNEDVHNYMNSCDVFVSMYDLSNVGNPLLEALSRGKAIITYDIGGTSAFVNSQLNNGILIPFSIDEEKVISSLKHKIVWIEKSREQLLMLEENANKFARANLYSWDERLTREVDILSTLWESAT